MGEDDGLLLDLDAPIKNTMYTVKKLAFIYGSSSLDYLGIIPQPQGNFKPLTAKEISHVHKRCFQMTGFNGILPLWSRVFFYQNSISMPK